MQKTKRSFALILAVALLVSLFTVQISAASTSSANAITYTDEAQITNLEAVKMLTSLGIINGMSDGKFNPTGTVTRAQMAKMIYVLRNGGVDDGAKGYPSMGFTDINGHWAAGYINAIAAAGIIGGFGNGKFCPDQEVTATQCYKMLLVLIGYNAQKTGLVGSNWARTTLGLAATEGLTYNITGSVTIGMQRQLAAQAIANCIDATRVKLDNGEYVEYAKTDIDPTVGEKYLGLKTAEGVYLGNHEFSVDGSTTNEGYIKILSVENGKTGDTLKLKSSADLTLVGQQVKVHYKTENDSTVNVVYGMYANGDSKLEPFTVVDDYDVDDLKTKSSKDAITFVNGEEEKNDSKNITVDTLIGDNNKYNVPKYAGLTLINNDGLKDKDGKDSAYNAIALITIPTLLKIDTDSSSTLTFSSALATSKFLESKPDTKTSFKLTDSKYTFDLPAKLAVDDVVLAWYNEMGSVLHVSAAASVSGKVDAIKKDGDSIRVSGTYYSYGYPSDSFMGYADDSDITAYNKISTGNTYTVYLCNGYYLAADRTAGSDSKGTYAVVKGAYVSGDDLKMKLYLSSDSTKTYTVEKFFGEKIEDLSDKELDALNTELNALVKNGLLVTYETSDANVNILAASDAKSLYTTTTLDIDDDDVKNANDYAIEDSYTVKQSGSDTDYFYRESFKALKNAKYTKIDTTAADITDASVYFTSEPTLFVQHNDDWDVYKLSDFSDDVNWKDLGTKSNLNIVAVRNGSDKIECLMIANGTYKPEADSNYFYAYVVDDPAKDDSTHTTLTVWTGSETKDLSVNKSVAKVTDTLGIQKHTLIAYTLDSDGKIDDLYAVMNNLHTSDKDEFGDHTIGYGKITGVDGDAYEVDVTAETNANAKAGKTSIKKTADSKIMVIDSDKTEGVSSTSITKNSYCVFVANSDDEIVFIATDTAASFTDDFKGANNIG